ncbi:MAG TPA: ATPase, T2SS/T4P/T4SS family [Acidimicrobiales bacterium]|nr:ATPase, T2SS/T4P/T4SS family [Acidimicrobiales bacterium]
MSTVSPLLEVERAVQERAKEVALDMATPEGAARLRALVDEEVARWSEDYKRGLRSIDIADAAAVAERAFRNVAGYGPLQPLLADDDVWEIMVNGPDAIFVKRHKGPSGYHDEVFHDDDHVVRTLTKILDDATGSHRKLDPAEGLQDAQLDTGARIHIVHGDVGRDGHLLVNIRKFTGIAYRSLHELVERDMLDGRVAGFLRACVRGRLSMVIAGAPGSGKTTLLSCCAAELDPSLRVVVAEEVFEADVPLPNVASMQTRPPRADRKEVDLRRLVAGFLRMAPDVAIVGEVRDREALPLLLTLSSGVKGLTTIHAGSARQALTRLRFICQLADTSSELPMSALNSLVSEAVDVVVHCTRAGEQVQVSEVVAVEELQTGRDSTAFTVTELFRRDRPGAPLAWTGNLPARAGRALEMAGYDVRELVGARVPVAEPPPAAPLDDAGALPLDGPPVERVRKAPPRPEAPGSRPERALRFGARRR